MSGDTFFTYTSSVLLNIAFHYRQEYDLSSFYYGIFCFLKYNCRNVRFLDLQFEDWKSYHTDLNTSEASCAGMPLRFSSVLKFTSAMQFSKHNRNEHDATLLVQREEKTCLEKIS